MMKMLMNTARAPTDLKAFPRGAPDPGCAVLATCGAQRDGFGFGPSILIPLTQHTRTHTHTYTHTHTNEQGSHIFPRVMSQCHGLGAMVPVTPSSSTFHARPHTRGKQVLVRHHGYRVDDGRVPEELRQRIALRNQKGGQGMGEAPTCSLGPSVDVSITFPPASHTFHTYLHVPHSNGHVVGS